MVNYRNIIKSREIRIKLLSLLDWVPDSVMLRFQYLLQTGRRLNLKNPKRYTEKLQLYKMKYRDKNMLRCTDKYEVRGFVKEKGLSEYLIPIVGIYDSIEDIHFSSLPQQFVAKTTDGGGGNQVFICKNKDEISEQYFLDKLNAWMNMPKTKQPGREWAYENNYPRRILIEKLISNGDLNEGLIDYKFFCFGGKVSYVYGVTDRHVGVSARMGIYDSDFNKLNVDRCDERHQEEVLPKPNNYNKMVLVAEQLSAEFPHVRVDLYNVNGNIYFGELTFYDGSGYMSFDPDSFDEELGRNFDVNTFSQSRIH